MSISSVCLVLVVVSSSCHGTKLPEAGKFVRGNFAISPSFTGRSNGYLPPVTEHCVPTTVTHMVIAPPEVRVLSPATRIETLTAVKELTKTVTQINEVIRNPVTITNKVTETTTTIRVDIFTQVPEVITSHVTRFMEAKHITPPAHQPPAVTPLPVVLPPVTRVALKTLPAVTAVVTRSVAAPLVTPPAVYLQPVTPAPVVPFPVTVTTRVIPDPEVKVVTPEPITQQIIVTRVIPAATSIVTSCGYSYPEPEQQLRF